MLLVWSVISVITIMWFITIINDINVGSVASDIRVMSLMIHKFYY